MRIDPSAFNTKSVSLLLLLMLLFPLLLNSDADTAASSLDDDADIVDIGLT